MKGIKKSLMGKGILSDNTKDILEQIEDRNKTHPTMDINAAPGTKVTFVYPDAGMEGHQKRAYQYLEMGAVYEVERTDVEAFHTHVYLKEFLDVSFNSVLFAPIINQGVQEPKSMYSLGKSYDDKFAEMKAAKLNQGDDDSEYNRITSGGENFMDLMKQAVAVDTGEEKHGFQVWEVRTSFYEDEEPVLAAGSPEWTMGEEDAKTTANAMRQYAGSFINMVAFFQERVSPWMQATFGAMVSGDKEERNYRFFEECAELIQACGATREKAHEMVDYTFDRPVGEKAQEVGGVMVTLAALCLAQELNMHDAGEDELTRIWKPDVMARIQEKQKTKPHRSPLPGVVDAVKRTYPHEWQPSTLGHGDSMCKYCFATNRELAVIGDLNHCPKREEKESSLSGPEFEDGPEFEGYAERSGTVSQETNDWQDFNKLPPGDTQVDLLLGNSVVVLNAVRQNYTNMFSFLDTDGNEVTEGIARWRFSVED